MWKLLVMLVTFSSGIIVGWLLPEKEIKERWERHYDFAMQAGQKASRQRRIELEQQLREMKTRHQQE